MACIANQQEPQLFNLRFKVCTALRKLSSALSPTIHLPSPARPPCYVVLPSQALSGALRQPAPARTFAGTLPLLKKPFNYVIASSSFFLPPSLAFLWCSPSTYFVPCLGTRGGPAPVLALKEVLCEGS